MNRKRWTALAAVIALIALGCDRPSGQDADPKTPGAGRICETSGQTAGRGGIIYECVRQPDGRLIWEKR